MPGFSLPGNNDDTSSRCAKGPGMPAVPTKLSKLFPFIIKTPPVLIVNYVVTLFPGIFPNWLASVTFSFFTGLISKIIIILYSVAVRIK